MTWPVNRRHEAERATALGVGGLISDDLRLLAALRERAYAGWRPERSASRSASVRNVISSAISADGQVDERDADCMPTPKATTLAADAVLRSA